MNKVTFKENICKGCGLCIDACPSKILEINKEKLNAKGYHPVHCIDMSKCKGCAMCAIMCPDVAIVVEKE